MKNLLTFFVLGFAGVALAQDAAQTFEEVDADANGQISRAEASLIEGSDFDSMDTNQDGSLSKEEYAATYEE